MALAPSSPHARVPRHRRLFLFLPQTSRVGRLGRSQSLPWSFHAEGRGLSDWTSRIKSDDQTCPSKLGQSPGALLIMGAARDKGTKQVLQGHSQEGGPLFLRIRPRGCSWGKR